MRIFIFSCFLVFRLSSGFCVTSEDMGHLIYLDGFVAYAIDQKCYSEKEVIFYGQEISKRDSHSYDLRPILYNSEKRCFTDLFTTEEFSEILAPWSLREVRAICADSKNAHFAVFVPKLTNKIEDATTLILIFDVKKKAIIYKSVENRCTSFPVFSPDGQYLAWFSHPQRWILEGNFGTVPANQVEVINLSTLKRRILSEEGPGFIKNVFYWTKDSKYLVFPNNEKTTNSFTKFIKSWSTETDKIEKLELKDDMAICEDLFMLDDGRLLYRTSREFFLMDNQFKSVKSLYRGGWVNSPKIEGNKLRFNDQEGKPGKGTPREILIPDK